jgi:predicted dehydrogenase
VARVHGTAEALIQDANVDAVYIATPPSSHYELALQVAAAGKPCLVEKPMAMTHAECVRMNDAFRAASVPLYVAYYRRALPRFLEVRRLLDSGAIGPVTDLHVRISEPLAKGDAAAGWRFDPAIAGAGLFLDLASHCLDLLDFLLGPIADASGFAVNTGGAYQAEDVTSGAFRFQRGMVGTGVWNFNADRVEDWIVITGAHGELRTPVFTDGDVVVRRGRHEEVLSVRNPPHVHQPLIQTIVDELRGTGRCESTGESGARASWVMDRLLENYRRM